MELIEQATYFRCKVCKKDVQHLTTCFGTCGECLYLRALGVESIYKYNDHLKRLQKGG